MDNFLWIYIFSCWMFIQAFSLTPNVSLSSGLKPQRKNSKMSKEFPFPYPKHPMKTDPDYNDFLLKQQRNLNISEETNEIPDNVEPKIINGREAEEGELSWMVALHYNGRFICSAFLISPTLVMTAAHCVQFDDSGVEPPQAFYGIVGNIRREGPETRIDFSEVAAHPNYGTGQEYDIALFRTTAPVQLSDRIQTICLPGAGRKFDKEKVQAMGWGVTSNVPGASPSETLMTTQLHVLSQTSCAIFFGWTGIRITDRHVCVNSIRATGVCFGDSGGPLVYQEEQTGRPLAIGVASFVTALGCGRPIVPSVYTATSGYTEWITQTAGEDSEICFSS